MSQGVPRLSPLLLREMAHDWVRDRIFSEKHVKPYRRELVLAIFPSARVALETNASVKTDCGLVFAFMRDKVPSTSIRVTDPRSGELRYYPVFRTCMLLHKDDVPVLQRMIEEERLRKRVSRKPKPFNPN